MYFSEYPKRAWIDAEFIDDETGEVFFVELRKESADETADEFIARCKTVANEYFDAPKFVRLVDPEEAEVLGYDTY